MPAKVEKNIQLQVQKKSYQSKLKEIEMKIYLKDIREALTSKSYYTVLYLNDLCLFIQSFPEIMFICFVNLLRFSKLCSQGLLFFFDIMLQSKHSLFMFFLNLLNLYQQGRLFLLQLFCCNKKNNTKALNHPGCNVHNFLP